MENKEIKRKDLDVLDRIKELLNKKDVSSIYDK